MAADCIVMRGAIEIALKNAFTGEVIGHVTRHNTVVTTGRRFALQQLASSEIQTAQSISQIAVGSGTAAPSTANTSLASEVTRKSIGTFTTTGLTANPPSWRAEANLATNEGNAALAEIGLFNSSSGGTMLARATFTSFNKTTSNTVAISYTISN